MDLNYVLLWISAASAILGIFTIAQQQSAERRPWIITFAVLLASTAFGALLYPSYAGYVSGSIYLLFVLVPIRAGAALRNRMLQQKYSAARRIAGFMRWIQPFGRWRDSLR